MFSILGDLSSLGIRFEAIRILKKTEKWGVIISSLFVGSANLAVEVTASLSPRKKIV